MKVNQITTELNRLSTLPYRCVFFNGLWGIGKSYAADQVSDKNNTFRVSLSGVKTSDELYTAILETVLKKNTGIKSIGNASRIINSVKGTIGRIKTEYSIPLELISSMVSTKVVLSHYLTNGLVSKVVILDDFERVWDEIDITEVFRVVEFLTNFSGVKVAIIGDLTKLSNGLKEKFETYSERYIEKIYSVESDFESISWDDEPLCIDRQFIMQFQRAHGCSNLRSIIKANNFYQDIKAFIVQNSTVIPKTATEFWDGLRYVAFALVVESCDGLKKNELEARRLKSKDDMLDDLENQLSYRVNMYLQGDVGYEYIEPLNRYFCSNEGNIESFEKIYHSMLKEKSVPLYYYDYNELKSKIPEMLTSIENENDVNNLIKYVNRYALASEMCKISYKDGLIAFERRLNELLAVQVKMGVVIRLGVEQYFFIENKDISNIIKHSYKDVQIKMVNSWITYLLENEFNDDSYEVASHLCDYCLSEEYKELIESRFDELLCKKIFGVYAKDEMAIMICKMLIEMLFQIDSVKVEEYSQSVLKDDTIDNVAKYRCKMVCSRE